MAHFLKKENKNFTSLYRLQYQKMPRETKSSKLDTGGVEAGGNTRIGDNPPTSEARWHVRITQLLQPMADSLSLTLSLALGGHHQWTRAISTPARTYLLSLSDTVYMAKVKLAFVFIWVLFLSCYLFSPECFLLDIIPFSE